MMKLMVIGMLSEYCRNEAIPEPCSWEETKYSNFSEFETFIDRDQSGRWLRSSAKTVSPVKATSEVSKPSPAKKSKKDAKKEAKKESKKKDVKKGKKESAPRKKVLKSMFVDIDAEMIEEDIRLMKKRSSSKDAGCDQEEEVKEIEACGSKRQKVEAVVCPVCDKSFPGKSEMEMATHVEECLTLSYLMDEAKQRAHPQAAPSSDGAPLKMILSGMQHVGKSYPESSSSSLQTQCWMLILPILGSAASALSPSLPVPRISSLRADACRSKCESIGMLMRLPRRLHHSLEPEIYDVPSPSSLTLSVQLILFHS